MKNNHLVALVLVVCTSFTSCNFRNIFGRSGEINVSSDVIIPSTTKSLTSENIRSIQTISDDKSVITLNNADLSMPSFSQGDVIVIGQSSLTPNGLLRKVESIVNDTNTTTVSTSNATLEDLIQEGRVYISHQLTTSDIQEIKLERSGVEFAPHVSSSTTIKDQAISDQLIYAKLFDVVLFDNDGDPTTLNDQIIVNGNFELSLGYLLDINIQDHGIENASFQISGGELLDLNFNWRYANNLNQQVKIATVNFLPQTIMLFGGIPIVIVPIFDIYIGINGKVNASVSAGIHQTLHVTEGITYSAQTNKWVPVNQVDPFFSYTLPSTFIDAQIECYINPELNLLIYGIVGPKISIKPYLELNISINPSTLVALYGGIRGDISIDFSIISDLLQLENPFYFKYEILNLRTELYRSTSDPIPPSLKLISYINGIEERSGYHGVTKVALSTDNTKVFASHWESGDQQVMDPIGIYSTVDNSYQGKIGVGGCLGGIATSENGRFLYSPSYYSGSVSSFDTWAGNFRNTLVLGNWANYLWINPDKTKLIVNYNAVNSNPTTSNTLALIDISTGNMNKLYSLSVGRPTSNGPIAFSKDGQYMYLGCCPSQNQGSTIIKIRMDSFTINSILEVNSDSNKSSSLSGIVPYNDDYIVADKDNNRIYIIEDASFSVKNTITLAYSPSIIGIHPNHKCLFVVSSTGGLLYVYSLPSFSLLTSISGLNQNPNDITFSDNGCKAYIAHFNQLNGGISVLECNNF